MKPLPFVIVDLITVSVLYAYLALYMVGFFALTPDFVASHGDTMWAIFAAVISFFYAFLQSRRRSVPRFLALFARLLFCLGLALFIDFMVYVWLYRPDDREWQLGAYSLSFIALSYCVQAFVLGYIARMLRDRLTMRSSQPPTGEKISS